MLPADLEVDETQVSRTVPVEAPIAQSIPFHAVTALISALGYRDHATAQHSCRVAELCVGLADGLMTRRDCYTLEIAAMLHDIGKVGVPDSILNKKGPLSSDEWALMQQYDVIGSEIVRSSFQSEPLSAIIDHCHAWYDGSKGSITGNEIPIGARILAITDSFDSMVNQSVYRNSKTARQAYAELRAGKGTQFDPELVERFISYDRMMSSSPARQLDGSMSKASALNIGLQLERLAVALDDHDLNGLQIMAQRIQQTAEREGADQIADTAARLEEQVVSDGDLIEILHQANELMSQCRIARSTIQLAEPASDGSL